MRRKTAILAAAVLFLLGLGAVPASAAGAAPAQEEGCFARTSSILFGEGIAVNCLPGEGYGYRVVAHCSAGSDFWFSLGTFVPYGFGPSVAECSGALLVPAVVGGYHIIAD